MKKRRVLDQGIKQPNSHYRIRSMHVEHWDLPVFLLPSVLSSTDNGSGKTGLIDT
ncbi:uncharacterized protein G2W53_012194 [Senna tora]|uniref:Uncharacterized protein n=1 Tax=Senna tora TaxID=362788 RepID=A0A834U0C0_9FABA|nr:uncharacterized protein G2W53_012194 [Senna tora]